MYVIVRNHRDWHKENLQLDRENTRNLTMQFEWGPCDRHIVLWGVNGAPEVFEGYFDDIGFL